MTDHKFTDEEIIELLNAYVERTCGKCNVKDLGTCCGTCFITAISQAADLINRQKAELEEKSKNITFAAKELIRLDRERSEVIKEFAERLKKKMYPYNGVDKKKYAINAYAVEQAIERTAKEMTEENK